MPFPSSFIFCSESFNTKEQRQCKNRFYNFFKSIKKTKLSISKLKCILSAKLHRSQVFKRSCTPFRSCSCTSKDFYTSFKCIKNTTSTATNIFTLVFPFYFTFNPKLCLFWDKNDIATYWLFAKVDSA